MQRAGNILFGRDCKKINLFQILAAVTSGMRALLCEQRMRGNLGPYNTDCKHIKSTGEIVTIKFHRSVSQVVVDVSIKLDKQYCKYTGTHN